MNMWKLDDLRRTRLLSCERNTKPNVTEFLIEVWMLFVHHLTMRISLHLDLPGLPHVQVPPVLMA
jgi:hypothetical protein